MHLGEKGSFSPSLGLGWALGQVHTPPSTFPPHHHPSWSSHAPSHLHACPHTDSLTHPVIRRKKHFKIKANVTKCFSSKGRHTRSRRVRHCAKVLSCFYLIFTLRGGSWDYPGYLEQENKAWRGSQLEQPVIDSADCQIGPWSGLVLVTTELGVL